MSKAKHDPIDYDFLFVLPWVHWAPPAGGYRVVYELARRLSRDGFDTGVLFLSNNIYKSHHNFFVKRLLNRHVPPFSTRRRRIEESLVSTIAEKEDFHRVQLIVSSGLNSIKARRVFATHFSTAYYTNRYVGNAEKYYLIEHSEDNPSYSGTLSSVARRSYSLPLRKIVTNRKMFIRFEQENPLFLRLGFANDFYKLTNPVEARGRTILFPLLQNESKGGVFGIEAMRLLRAEIPEVEILSFGDWPESRLPPFISEYFGHFSQGSYSGPRNQNLLRLYNKASVFMLPSLVEGFSLPTLEAMHSGCAVVVTNNGGINEYVRDDFNGLIVPIKDSLSLKNAVLSLITDPQKRTEIAKNGIATSEQYSFERSYHSFLSLMKLDESARTSTDMTR